MVDNTMLFEDLKVAWPLVHAAMCRICHCYCRLMQVNPKYEFVGLQFDVLDLCEKVLGIMSQNEQRVVGCDIHRSFQDMALWQNMVVKYGTPVITTQSFLYDLVLGDFDSYYKLYCNYAE